MKYNLVLCNRRGQSSIVETCYSFIEAREKWKTFAKMRRSRVTKRKPQYYWVQAVFNGMDADVSYYIFGEE